MLVAVMRVRGLDFDVDECLRSVKGLEPERVWHRGERIGSRVMKGSGFTVSIGEPEDAKEIGIMVKAFVERNAGLIEDCVRLGGESTVDVGVGVGSQDHFTRSVVFDVDVLLVLAQRGVNLEITGYPVSDDEEPE